MVRPECAAKRPGRLCLRRGQTRNSAANAGWLRRNRIDPADVLFAVTDAPVGILDEGDTADLQAEIRQICAAYGVDAPILIIIDTLQRNFGPGDENSTEDMTLFVSRLDSYLREPFGACVLVIHHCGQIDKTRSRGSIVMKSSCEMEFGFTKSAIRQLSRWKTPS